MLVEIGTLGWHNVSPSNGLAVVGANFSPDGGRVAVALLDPAQKKTATVLANSKFGGIQPLPAGMQFMRWLGKDEVLLKIPGHLIRHSLGAGQDHIFEPPAGWG